MADVATDFAQMMGQQLFPVLLTTPSYTTILERSGLKPPFKRFVGPGAAPLPAGFREQWAVYTKLILAEVHKAQSLDSASLRATVLRGPVTIYRILSSAAPSADATAWHKGTTYCGDWWFDEPLWRAILKEANGRPLTGTDMTKERVIRTLLRRQLAISIDWNKAAVVRSMKLPAGTELPVITGKGLPMPVYSPGVKTEIKTGAGKQVYVPGGKSLGSPHAQFGHMILPGGAQQIWVPWTPNGVLMPVEMQLGAVAANA